MVSPVTQTHTPVLPELEATVAQPERDKATLLGAYRTIFGVIPRAGTGIIGLAALGYLLGWQTASSYYRAFGAEWVVSLLSPVELLQRAYGPLSTLAVGLIIGVVNSTTGGWSKRSISRADAATGLLATLLLIVGVVGDRYFTPSVTVVISVFTSLLLATSLGFTVAMHAYALREQRLQWGTRQLSLIYTLWLLIITQLPMISGRPQGLLAANPMLSKLPVVEARGTQWRLLLARSDRLVVAKLRSNNKPLVRILPSDEVESVHEPE